MAVILVVIITKRGFCFYAKIGTMNPKDQVKENLSITDVVSTYIRLEKSGAQFRARCPFHRKSCCQNFRIQDMELIF